MAAYSQFLGCAVKVHYRLGDVLLTASGTFVADSGRSVFLEQHVEQRGKRNYFRWEIPYAYLHRIELMPEPAEPKPQPEPPAAAEPKAAAASASASESITGPCRVIPFPQRREPA
jgi:hypothetical protein